MLAGGPSFSKFRVTEFSSHRAQPEPRSSPERKLAYPKSYNPHRKHANPFNAAEPLKPRENEKTVRKVVT